MTDVSSEQRVLRGRSVVAWGLAFLLVSSGSALANHKDGHGSPGGDSTTSLSDLACASGEVAKFDGTQWACADDDDTQLDQAAIEAMGFVTGPHTVDTDTNAATKCSGDEVLTGDDSCLSLASLASAEPEAKTIFATSERYDANLGGIAGADTICQDHADGTESIVPAGTYIALLSSDTVQASARPSHRLKPIIRPDGAPVAANLVALFSTNSAVTLANPVDIDETGEQITGAFEVQTGSTSGGIRAPDEEFFGPSHCENWTSNSVALSQIWRAIPSATNAAWFGVESFPEFSECSAPRHIYCLQQ